MKVEIKVMFIIVIIANANAFISAILRSEVVALSGMVGLGSALYLGKLMGEEKADRYLYGEEGK